jgi:hypothetical protein
MQLHYPTAVVLAVFTFSCTPGSFGEAFILEVKNSSSVVQVYSSYRDWASSVSLLKVDTSDCWFGTIDCPDGSVTS